MAQPDYKTFVRTILDDGGDWSDTALHELAVKHGILEEVSYDPEIHGQHEYAEPGDPWHVFVEKGDES